MDLIMTIPEDQHLSDSESDDDIKESQTLNDSFSFSFQDQTEHPWSFEDALKTTLKDDSKQTTINEKIQQRIQKSKPEKKDKKEKGKEKEKTVDTNGKKSKKEETQKDIKKKPIKEDEKVENKVTETKTEPVEEDKLVSYESRKDSRKKKKSEKAVEIKEEKEEEEEPTVEWEDLRLGKALLKSISNHGYSHPTPIQVKSIPAILAGNDLCSSAVTGSGKTAAFVLPILQTLLLRDRQYASTRVVILSPTRELAAQTHSYIQGFNKFTSIRCTLVVGGLSLQSQESEMRTFPDIIVATPGRLIDHVRNSKSIGLEDVEILVLDEADRLLDLGFEDELKEIIKACPVGRQTLLFSATMTDEVSRLAKLSLRNPLKISVDRKFDVAENLTQEFVRLHSDTDYDREAVVLALCLRTIKSKAIIFCAHKKDAHRLKVIFGLAELNAAELHGNLTQQQRLLALQDFRDQKVDYLIATDVASRGLDILGVETVINFAMPKTLTDYVHRVGRTARAGSSGKSISVIGNSYADRKLLKDIAKRAKSKLKQRTLPVDILTECRDRVEKMEQDINDIFAEEREEKQLRLADMQINKGNNMIEHQEEIYSRPKRTWFQTNEEKKAIKDKSSEAYLNKDGEEGEGEGEGEGNGGGKKKRKRDDAPPQRLSKFEKIKAARAEQLLQTKRDQLSQKIIAKNFRKGKMELPKRKKQKKSNDNLGSFETEKKKNEGVAPKPKPKSKPSSGGSFKSKKRYKRR